MAQLKEGSTVGGKEIANKEQVDAVQQQVASHVADYAAHGDISKKSLLSKDENGIFTTVEWKRPDGTLAKRSVLSGGESPQYTTRTVTYYGEDGITVTKEVVYTQQYDEDGDWIGEVIQSV